MMGNLRNPFLFDILEAWRGDNAEAHEEDVCLGVGEWPQPVVILLARRVEKAECVGLASDHHGHCIVVEHL